MQALKRRTGLLGLLLFTAATIVAALIEDARNNCHWHTDMRDWLNCVVQ
jgi:hypothetical protein